MRIPHALLYSVALLAFFLSTSLPALATSAKVTPDLLSSMELHTEALVKKALAKDGPACQHLYQQINIELDQLHYDSQTGSFDERRSRELILAFSWIRVINMDLQRQSWIGVAIGANQLSGSIFRFTQFSDVRKREIAWLDYLGREVMLLNMEDANANQDMLNVRLIELFATWQLLKKELIRNFHNKSLVMKGDRLIGQLKKEDKPVQAIALAKQLHDFIGDIKEAK